MAYMILPNSTKKVVTAFASYFTNYKLYSVDPQNNNSTIIQKIPIYMASTQKLITMINQNKDGSVERCVPAFGINITSIDIDENRLQNPNNGYNSGDFAQYLPGSMPVNYSIDLSMTAKKESDLFQLIERVLSSFKKTQKFPLVEFRFSDGTELIRDIEITLQNPSIDLRELDISGTERKLFYCTFTFIIKGWAASDLIFDSETGLIDEENRDEAGNIIIDDPDLSAPVARPIKKIDIDFFLDQERTYNSYSIEAIEVTGGYDIETTVTEKEL